MKIHWHLMDLILRIWRLVLPLSFRQSSVAQVTSLSSIIAHWALCCPVTLPPNSTIQLALFLNTGNFLQNPVNKRVAHCSARWKIERQTATSTFQELQQLASGKYILLNVFVVLCAWCWKIYRVQKAETVERGLKDKEHPMSSDTLGDS